MSWIKQPHRWFWPWGFICSCVLKRLNPPHAKLGRSSEEVHITNIISKRIDKFQCITQQVLNKQSPKAMTAWKIWQCEFRDNETGQMISIVSMTGLFLHFKRLAQHRWKDKPKKKKKAASLLSKRINNAVNTMHTAAGWEPERCEATPTPGTKHRWKGEVRGREWGPGSKSWGDSW